MTRSRTCQIMLLALFLPAVPLAAVDAAQPAAQLLPAHTRGYLSIPNIDGMLEAWSQTDLGRLADDPAMRPFLDDLVPRFRDQLSETNLRFGLTWEDLRNIAAGEVCVAALEPAGPNTHALALLVDIGPRTKEAGQLLKTVQTRMHQRRAKIGMETHHGLRVTTYRLPAKGDRAAHSAYLIVHQNQLLATDHLAVVHNVIQRWQGKKLATLANLAAFQQTHSRTRFSEPQTVAHVHWFVEPFGLARILRATAGGRTKRGTDMLQVLENQGFAAVEGLGGQIALHTAEHEILHRTFIYAAAPRKLAARMLQFSNGAALEAPAWVPANVANYVALRWDMQNAFEHSKSLVNELAGEKFFDEFLENLEQDPNGPQVNLREDLVQHLGHNIVFISDCQKPITPQSERFLCAIEIKDGDAVRHTVNQMLQPDPAAKRHVVDGHVIWEISQPEPEEEMLVTVEISGAGFDFGSPAEEPAAEESVTTLPRCAITVIEGRLIVASNVEYVVEVLRPSSQPALATSADYQRVSLALEKLGAGHESFRVFSRSDETYHATYELLRQNRMNESDSLLGRLLKRIDASQGTASRVQQFDGSRLPEFTALEPYLGPAGVFVESQADGWSITGCLLSKADK